MNKDRAGFTLKKNVSLNFYWTHTQQIKCIVNFSSFILDMINISGSPMEPLRDDITLHASNVTTSGKRPSLEVFSYNREHAPFFFAPPRDESECIIWEKSVKQALRSYTKLIRCGNVGHEIILPNGMTTGEVAMWSISRTHSRRNTEM